MGGVIGNNSVILPLAVMQEIIKRPGMVTVFHIRLNSPEDPASLSIAQSTASGCFFDLSFLEASTAVSGDTALPIFRAISWSISVMAVIIALVVMVILCEVLDRRTRSVSFRLSAGPLRGLWE